MIQISPLAKQVDRRKDKIRLRKPWGLLLHTTGSGITSLAAKKKRKPIDVALSIYRDMQNGSQGYDWGGPHYVVDHDGSIYQIADDNYVTAHCGGPWRAVHLNGTWKQKCSPEMVKQWEKRWPAYESPSHLYPSKSGNTDYIGVEMIPCGSGFGAPMVSGLKFTKAQHDACVALARDVAQRHGWPEGWQAGARLVGHEDVQPLERSDAGGGWDPGSLRARPYFDFAYVRSGV